MLARRYVAALKSFTGQNDCTRVQIALATIVRCSLRKVLRVPRFSDVESVTFWNSSVRTARRNKTKEATLLICTTGSSFTSWNFSVQFFRASRLLPPASWIRNVAFVFALFSEFDFYIAQQNLWGKYAPVRIAWWLHSECRMPVWGYLECRRCKTLEWKVDRCLRHSSPDKESQKILRTLCHDACNVGGSFKCHRSTMNFNQQTGVKNRPLSFQITWRF